MKKENKNEMSTKCMKEKAIKSEIYLALSFLSHQTFQKYSDRHRGFVGLQVCILNIRYYCKVAVTGFSTTFYSLLSIIKCDYKYIVHT